MAVTPYSDIRFLGRSKLYTYLTEEQTLGDDAVELIREDLVNYVLPLHYSNAVECKYLIEYYAGYHPNIAHRDKPTRSDVDNRITINYAKSATRDIVSYFLGKPIENVQREDRFREAVNDFNESLDAENKQKVDIEIATNQSICGVGYKGNFTEATPMNGTHLNLQSLDPVTTFVVHSPNPEEGALYCGTHYTTPPNPEDNSSKTIYTIYTKNRKITYVSKGSGGTFSTIGLEADGEPVPMSLDGYLPIVMYPNSILMIGDWESELSMMDALDKLGSDSVNDIEQFVNSILLAQGFEMTPDALQMLEEKKLLNIPDIPQGVQVVVKYIAEQLDSENISTLREWLESTMRIIIGVPDRKNRGGGGADTGNAVYLRDGWQDIDLVAKSKEDFFVEAERQSLGACLSILQSYNEVSKELSLQDVEIKFTRTKQANILAKVQAFTMLVGSEFPIAPADALDMVDLTTNVNDVIMRATEFQDEKNERDIELQVALETALADIQKEYNSDSQSSGASASQISTKQPDDNGNKRKGTE